MADPADENVYEVEQLLVQPGTYFNPQTEVVVLVDDSGSVSETALEQGDAEVDEDEEGQDPGRED